MNSLAMNKGNLIKNLSTSTFKKMKNLINNLTIVCDGLTIYFVYVIVLLGPYYANTKDAKILEELLYDNPDFQNLLSPGDVFV